MSWQPVAAQTPPLTLGQAVQQSLDKYPVVRSSLEQVSAASAGINLARAAYLPRADFLGLVNRATHNNVFGLLLPQSILPTISGPAQGTNSLSSVWGSAAGALVSWEPFDFGLRRSAVDTAKATRDRARADANVTKLQVATAAADAFLTIAAAQQTVIAARAGVERARVLDQVIGTLATNQLRPGADASRSRAELALAQTQEIQAEQAVDVARAALAQLLGTGLKSIAIEPGILLQLPPVSEIPSLSPGSCLFLFRLPWALRWFRRICCPPRWFLCLPRGRCERPRKADGSLDGANGMRRHCDIL
jgi:outer membrane protein TolC